MTVKDVHLTVTADAAPAIRAINQARRAALLSHSDILLNSVMAAGRDITAEEQSILDGIEEQLHAMEMEEQSMDDREEKRLELSQNPGVSISGVRDRAESDPTAGFADMREFALAVRNAHVPTGSLDPRLRFLAAPSTFLSGNGASGEGYLVPPEFRAGIWELVFDDPLIEQFTFEPTQSGQVDLLADESTPWGATGVLAYWRVEGSQMASWTKPGVEYRSTRTHQMYALVAATNELLRDAPLLNDRITRAASDAIAWKLGEAIIRGTGAGMPLGILTSAVTVSQAKETNQAADTVVAGNVLKMYGRVIRAGGRPFWLINPDVFAQLPQMTVGQQPVFLAPNGLIPAPDGGFLLGLPVYMSEHCDTVGDVGDILLINPAGYHAIRRTDAPEFASSIHLFFDYNMTAFRWTFEVGGQPFLEAAVTPPNSAITKSHFVSLAART